MGIFSFINSKGKLEQFINQEHLLLDVRTKKEFETNNIPNSINIPVSSIKDNITTIKNYNKPVIVYCASGVRSAMAARLLKSNAIKVINGGGISKIRKKLNQ